MLVLQFRRMNFILLSVNLVTISNDNHNHASGQNNSNISEPSVALNTPDSEIWSEWPRRNRRQPQRLDIASWNSKSYDK